MSLIALLWFCFGNIPAPSPEERSLISINISKKGAHLFASPPTHCESSSQPPKPVDVPEPLATHGLSASLISVSLRIILALKRNNMYLGTAEIFSCFISGLLQVPRMHWEF